MSEKSRGIDTWATRHCPVVIFNGNNIVSEYASISDCAKDLHITPAKVKHYLHYSELFKGLEFDIPASSIYETKLETVVRKRGMKNVVRIVRRDKQKRPVRRFERIYKEGKMIIRPLEDNVLLAKCAEKKTASGLILIENEDYSGLTIGEIRAIGENVDKVKVGDKVLYQDADTTQVTVDGENLFIVAQGNLFATLEG